MDIVKPATGHLTPNVPDAEPDIIKMATPVTDPALQINGETMVQENANLVIRHVFHALGEPPTNVPHAPDLESNSAQPAL